jgi:hypothetical protein
MRRNCNKYQMETVIVEDEDNLVFQDSDVNDRPDKIIEGKMKWTDVSWIMLADVMGTSILTFGLVASQLGWLLLFLLMLFFAATALFSAHLMSKTYNILREVSIAIRCFN